ncbi:MAG: gliding motility protein GldM [Dysgonamonadaceae bacterium]|jgi:gliding motility-associated protein GldM|nr:gliding motility protein GldM [Dysgonamonadaceae bacterium]
MAANSANSPRQRMINLMYLVFIAMLALNAPTEVLEGIELVEESLLRSVKTSTERNDRIFEDLETSYETNPEKTKEWYDHAAAVKAKTDSIFNYIQDLKVNIVKKSDGKDGDPENMKYPDDLNASTQVMFKRGENHAKKLKEELDNYRVFASSLVNNPQIKSTIESNLSTEPSAKAKKNKESWEESLFLDVPMAAAIAFLTKMQNDIRYAEGEVLADLRKNIDIDDFRVNKIEAFVIPEAQTVMRGTPYRADIVLAALDSTQKPRVFVNGKMLDDELNGKYVAGTAATGSFNVNGYIEMPRSDGSFSKHDFTSQYFVVEPSATVAPVLMNMLYAGIDNEIRIAVPGVANQNVTATISNGTLTNRGNGIWVAKPRLGSDAIISVNARLAGGRTQEMAKSTFRVRQLPDPSAYINITNPDGNQTRFKGGRLSKTALLAAESLNAAIDDGILDIQFTVISFEVSTLGSMDLTVRESSNGARFSDRQKNMIRGLQRNSTALLRGIVVRGPDGTERRLNTPLEIIVN